MRLIKALSRLSKRASRWHGFGNHSPEHRTRRDISRPSLRLERLEDRALLSVGGLGGFDQNLLAVSVYDVASAALGSQPIDKQVISQDSSILALPEKSFGALSPQTSTGDITPSVAFTGNDNFINRTNFGSVNSVTATGSNVGYTGEAGEPAQSYAINSAWGSWTAPSSGTLTVDTNDSGFDTYLTLATGSAVNALTVLAQDDDGGNGLQSLITWNVTGGTQYQIAIDGWSSNTGNITLNLAFVGTSPGSIAGQKFNDLDGDGVKDADEPGLAGWHIYLDENSDGAFTAGEPDALTQADGSYIIQNVPAGLHVVVEEPQAGWTQTSPTSALALEQRFDGLPYSGSRPPDPIAAAGPSNVLAMVNRNIGIYEKTGALQATATLSSFFDTVDHNFGPFDPWMVYDRYSGRYIVMAEESDFVDEAYILIGVSTTSAPNDLNLASAGGDWYVYSIPATRDFGGGSAWVDYPKIAADADSLYLTGNYFRFSDRAFQGVMISRLDKTPMLSGTLGTRTDIVAPSAVFTLQPAQSIGRSASEPQLFVDDWTHYGTGITVWELNDSNVLTEKANLGGAWTWASAGAPQLGTSDTIDTLSPRLMNAVWRDNSLWTTHTVSVGGEATVRWYQVSTTGGVYSLVQQGDVDPGPGIHAFTPAIAVDGSGNMGLTYTQSSTSQFPSMMVAGRQSGDPLGTTLPGTVVKTSSTFYNPSSSTEERWGDYSGISVDPSDDSTFWAFNEYVVSNTAWGTSWGSFDFGSPQPSPQWVVVHSGVTETGINFGNRQLQLGSIAGQKFNDLDGDGVKDAGEPGLQDWTIQLDLGNNGSVDQTQVTDANGNYSFTAIGPGTHKLAEVLQAGWVQTFPAPVPPGTYVATTQSGLNVIGKYFGNHAVAEVAVSGNNQNIVNADSTPATADWTDYGSVVQGAAAVSHTFRVSNTGTAVLTTSGLTAPAGFSVTTSLSESIAAGSYADFTVTLNTASAGTFAGDISFANNDGDGGDGIEDPFHFRVTGTVAAAASEIIIDNTAPNVTIVGAWTASTSTPGYFGSNYQHDGNANKGTKSVRFTPDLLGGSYEVFARWPAGLNRATNVPIDITSAGGTATVLVNQQLNNNVWVSLGTYNFNAGTGSYVTIRTTGTNGYVIADAVAFSEVVALTIDATIAPQGSPVSLTDQQLAPIVVEAERRLAAVSNIPVLAAMASVKIQIADLPGGLLGEAVGTTILMDRDAAGYGWFLDSTPADDLEFADVLGPHALAAGNNSPAALRVDLLTAVMHEMMHVLGKEHSDSLDLMYPTLSLGMRRSFEGHLALSMETQESDGGLSNGLAGASVLDQVFASFHSNGKKKWYSA